MAGHLLDTLHKARRSHPQLLQDYERNRVAQQFQVLQSAMVLQFGCTLVLDPDVFVGNLMGDQRLQFVSIGDPEHWLADKQNYSLGKSSPGNRAVDYCPARFG